MGSTCGITTTTLTERQFDVLDGVAHYLIERGYAPTCVELGEWLGIGPKTAWRYLGCLDEAGLVRIMRGEARAIVLTAAGWRSLGYSEPPRFPVIEE